MDTTLKALRYFLAAVNYGSITEASRNMHVVPSAILAAVNQVEESFGLKLTSRHRAKGVTLTATGHILVKKIQHLLDEYETLMKEGADLQSQLMGTLRVGYYAPVAPAFIPGIVEPLLAENANVEIKFFECDNQTAQVGLMAGYYDVIVCVANSMKPEITYETLTEVPAYLLTYTDHPFASRESVSIMDLSAQKMILLDLPVVSEYYSQIFEEAGISPPVVSTATTVEMVRSLVSVGLGCSILHMRPFTDISYAGRKVVALPFDRPTNPLRIVLGHLPENPRRLVKAFVDQMRINFACEEVNKLLVSLPLTDSKD